MAEKYQGGPATHVELSHLGSQALYKHLIFRMNFQPLLPLEPFVFLQESLSKE